MNRKRLIDKPVVKYINAAEFVKVTLTDPATIKEYKQYLKKDNSYEYAKVYAVGHPLLGSDFVRTSIVVKKHKDGSFETMNTLYVPAEVAGD